MGSNRKATRFLIAALTLVAAGVNVTFRGSIGQAVAGLALLTVLPGLALSLLLFPEALRHPLDRLALGVGFSLTIGALGMLALAALPMTPNPTIFVAFLAGLTLLFAIAATGMHPPSPVDVLPPAPLRIGWLPPIILAIAAYFRFAGLGQSEFQGDEAGNCLMNSLAILHGHSDALLWARRPPVQVLLPAATRLLTGSFREGLIRFPFALAGLAGVWLVFWIVRELDGRRGAVVAELLAALCGYFVAFARLAQYQSIVTMALLLCVLFLWRFVTALSAREERRGLLLAAAAYGFAGLAHYEGFLLAPVFIAAVGARYGRRAFLKAPLWMALAIVGVIVLPFYVPFVVNPAFTQAVTDYGTTRYDASLHFNLPTLLIGGAFYNTGQYLALLALLAIAALIFKKRTRATDGHGAVGFGLIFIWFVTYFAWYMIVCSTPKTHVYAYFAPWIMLAGMGYARLTDGLSARAGATSPAWYSMLRRGAALLLVAWALSVALPLRARFLNNSPEYVWRRVLQGIERDAVFGFPYHRGWKAVGYLFRAGELKGPYATNERPKIPSFYLREPPGEPANAPTVIVVKDPQSFFPPTIPAGYAPAIRIVEHGQVTMEIYNRKPRVGGPRTIQADAFDARFFALPD
jgi:4-amino-4-deoxy-L-arabinose transferase-like glycosyltransferase